MILTAQLRARPSHAPLKGLKQGDPWDQVAPCDLPTRQKCHEPWCLPATQGNEDKRRLQYSRAGLLRSHESKRQQRYRRIEGKLDFDCARQLGLRRFDRWKHLLAGRGAPRPYGLGTYPDTSEGGILRPSSAVADFGRRRPKRTRLRQGHGGYPPRIHPRVYTRGLLRRRVNHQVPRR